MIDDIVTQLRYIYSQKDVGVSVNPETFTEAADEIERLRELTSSLAKLMMPFALLMTKDEQEMVLKAVRGDY